ncbi:TPA: hypothetical protein ACOEHE_001931 [Enterobacter ludwigii]
MSNHPNHANIIKRLAFYSLAIISNERATGPKRVLLAAAKPY